MSTSSVRHFGTQTDLDLRFFALVHKYFLVLDSIRIEKVIFFCFFGGVPPKLLLNRNRYNLLDYFIILVMANMNNEFFSVFRKNEYLAV